MKTIAAKIRARLVGVYDPSEYPALAFQMREWGTESLRGLRILDTTPVFRNTMVKYLPLLDAGAELSVGISEVMPCDPQIVAFLRETGVSVVSPSEAVEREYDLVLDCAGAFSGVDAKIGYVELTRSGVAHYEGCVKPVYVADSGRIKRIETMLGTGESYFRAMEARGYANWNGQRLVLFGSGKVGSGILFYALRKGARVTVVTDPATLAPEFASAVERVLKPDAREQIACAVREAYAVVTATGVAGVVTLCGADRVAVESQALLANMGVEDEFGPSVPSERVLSDKRPLNFELEEPTHLKYIDATMALHNAGALYLLHHPDAHGLLEPDAQSEAALLEVSCRADAVAGREIEAVVA